MSKSQREKQASLAHPRSLTSQEAHRGAPPRTTQLSRQNRQDGRRLKTSLTRANCLRMGRYRESEDNRLDGIDKEEDEYEETEDEEKREKVIQEYMKSEEAPSRSNQEAQQDSTRQGPRRGYGEARCRPYGSEALTAARKTQFLLTNYAHSENVEDGTDGGKGATKEEKEAREREEKRAEEFARRDKGRDERNLAHHRGLGSSILPCLLIGWSSHHEPRQHQAVSASRRCALV